MKKVLMLLMLFLCGLSYSQIYDDTIKFDCMEAYDWSGNWWSGAATTGFFTNASKSSPTSAVIYGSGNNADEFDWYSLPNITGLDPFLEYKIQINLGSYRFTSTTGAAGVDATDYVDVQISLDGGSTYNSELRVTGFNNAYWDYNSQVASVNVDGTVDIFTPAGGGNRTSTGDGYSVLELILPFGTTQVAVDILSVVDRLGEEWWIDDIYLLGTRNTPLPIELISFDAEYDGEKEVIIEWSTASQINNNYFTIETSTDGYEWEELTKINGCGNCNTQIDYRIVDENPFKGVSYYRLTQTDYDGVFEIFDPVSVIIKEERKEVVKAYNQMGQEVSIDTKGLLILVWDNGDITKTINN